MPDSLIGNFVSTLIGGAVTYFATRQHEYWRQRHEAKVMNAAVVAEIGALLLIINERRYLPHIDSLIEKLKAARLARVRGDEKEPKEKLGFKTKEIGLPVLEASLPKVGLLWEEIINDVIVFKTIQEGLMLDVGPGGILSEGAELPAFENARALGVRLIETGNRVVENYEKRLKKESERKWWQCCSKPTLPVGAAKEGDQERGKESGK